MATTYKTFLDDDIVSTKTLLHENIPITGTIVGISSSYRGAASGDRALKTYSHGMFTSFYDYPYQSSSANHLFDATIGLSSGSIGSSGPHNGTDAYASKKINIYNQMAQTLVGFDTTGSILKFDRDGDQASGIVTDKYTSAFFLNFSRLLVKDEIKKGSFQLTLGIGTSNTDPTAQTCLVSDSEAATNYKTNSPIGEFGILKISGISGNDGNNPNEEVGLIYYQAGVAVLSTAIFAASASISPVNAIESNSQGQLSTAVPFSGSGTTTFANLKNLFRSGSIDDAVIGFKKKIKNITFNNTTELNSTIHFCRINHNDFNYSSNPTYLSQSQIVVKNKTTDAPVSYITTVGLYSPDNELLAVAKLSEPIKKDPTQEIILRVRLDY
jgi:hypothetical protein